MYLYCHETQREFGNMYLGLFERCVFTGWGDWPTPNPQPGGQGAVLCYWGTEAPAGIALGIIKTHKLHHHYKWVQGEELYFSSVLK